MPKLNITVKLLLAEVEEEFGLTIGFLLSSMQSIEEQLLSCFPLVSVKQQVAAKVYKKHLLVDAWDSVLPSSGLLLDMFSFQGSSKEDKAVQASSSLARL